MTQDHAILFALLAVLFGLLIWGRFRYDLVAFLALLVAVLAGLVPTDEAFSGFGHPATVIVALVLIISRGLTNAGVIEMIASRVVDSSRTLWAHIGIMAAVSAALSAVMNNVAALALLMPVDIQAAKKAGRSAALSLMPLSFASILGGMVTLIGTPPNIIIAAYREEAVGTPFSMFDFAPVGIAVAAAGVIYVAFAGWRLIPPARAETSVSGELHALEEYIAELEVEEDSKAAGEAVSSLDEAAEEHDIQILGLIRNGQRMPGLARQATLREGDVLVIEGGPEGIDGFAGAANLGYVEHDEDDDALKGQDLEMREVVVPPTAYVEGRVVGRMAALRRHGISLLGISRQGERIYERLRSARVQAGDVLLLLGPGDSVTEATERLGCLPLAERGLQVIQRRHAALATATFAGAILLASLGIVYLAVALACVAALYVLLGIVPLRELYASVEWSVIVLLGALIPVGQALETSGGAGLIAQGLVYLSEGYAPWVVLTLLMVVTMTLSDVMNNTAMAVMGAPIAVDIATRLGVDPDPFLMAVAVAASCAFLTPIGHKNNTLIMGPGGYRFADYWRMGLPLEAIVILVAVPMILLVWPL